MGVFGWGLSNDTPWRLLAAIALPVTAMVIWAVFAVPGDRSRSGKAPIPIAGSLRLVLELGFFGFSIWSLFYTAEWAAGLLFSGALIVHYALSIDRIRWLLGRADIK